MAGFLAASSGVPFSGNLGYAQEQHSHLRPLDRFARCEESENLHNRITKTQLTQVYRNHVNILYKNCLINSLSPIRDFVFTLKYLFSYILNVYTCFIRNI